MSSLQEADFPPFLAGKQERPSKGWGAHGDQGSTSSAMACARRGNPHTQRHYVHLEWTLARSTDFFPHWRTSFQEHKGADPLYAFCMLSMWFQSIIMEAELWICSHQDAISHVHFFFSISTRKCYLTLSVFLSHWNSNLQKCLESQTQRSGPLTTQWCVKKKKSKETTKASRSQMKDPNDFAEMSMWVIYLVLPEEDTIKEYDNFQGFYWHTLHSLKEKKKSILWLLRITSDCIGQKLTDITLDKHYWDTQRSCCAFKLMVHCNAVNEKPLLWGDVYVSIWNKSSFY